MSAEVFMVFRSFTPLVEGLSLDEAFLDISGLRNHFESPVAVGQSIRGRLRSELGLPASVGVASTKFMAKLASEAAKPDGILVVEKVSELEFLHGLGAQSLWGVGPATLAALERLGVATVGDISELPLSVLANSVGPSLGRHLHELANGRDPRPVEPDTAAKSISVEETYESDLVGYELVETAVLSHAQELSVRLRRSGLAARTVTLKIRFGDFTTITRSHTLGGAVDGARDLFRVAVGLLKDVDASRPVRLIGLGGSALEESSEPRQMGFGSSAEWSRVEDAVSSIRDKFGPAAVSPARLVPAPDGQTSEDQG
jgi:DNA polymerase-4